MKINADITNINFKGSGIAVFEYELLTRLASMDDFELRGCTNYVRAFRKKDFDWLPFKTKYSWLPKKIAYGAGVPVSYETLMGDADVNLFCAYTTPSLVFKKPVIATIHDIILQKVGTEDPSIIKEYDDKLRHTISIADEIITVSESTKKDLIEYYGISPDAITVIYNGVDFSRFSSIVSQEKRDKVATKYNLPNKFFLYMGAIRKHKNVEGIISAYSTLPKYVRDEYKLVITKKDNSVMLLAESLGVSSDVVFTDFIEEDDKVCLYQLAYACLFISFYEGFGIPVIESMASGTPVITSNLSSLPEAAGDAAIFVNPYSVEEIASAITQMINDRLLYDNLVVKGYENAKKYSWDISALKLKELLLKYK